MNSLSAASKEEFIDNFADLVIGDALFPSNIEQAIAQEVESLVKGKLRFVLKYDNNEIDWHSIALEMGINDSSDSHYIASMLLKSIVNKVLSRHNQPFVLVDHKAPTTNRPQNKKDWVYLAE